MAKKIKQVVDFKLANNRALWALMVFDAVVIAAILNIPIGLPVTASGMLQALITRGILPVIGGTILVGYVNGVIPANVKASIIYWRWSEALPGHRAFSDHAKADPRINVETLKRNVGNFPISGKEQNALWYGLLKKHERSPQVSGAHRQFLLFRDAASLTLLAMIAVAIPTVYQVVHLQKIIYIEMLAFGQFIWLTVSARHSGVGLVRNVLALEAISKKGKSE